MSLVITIYVNVNFLTIMKEPFFFFNSILIGTNEIVKISDFGLCKTWDCKSTTMSFAGTVAWMAPEVIRHEPCSEKVDIWSFGVVLWEMLLCEFPYKDYDSSAILWGVGNNTLSLPIPKTCPEGFQYLLNLCWKIKPKHRPSFPEITKHIEIAGEFLLKNVNDEEFFDNRRLWKDEVDKKLLQSSKSNINIEHDLIKRRASELSTARDIRQIYIAKLADTNKLYIQLSECKAQLEEKEKEISQ